MKSQKIPIVLTREEMERLIAVPVNDLGNHLNDHQRFNAIRNEAILKLAFSTGLRVQEVCNLNADSLFPEEWQLKIREGKFGNEDYQPLTRQETWDSLDRYLKLREKVENKGEALFVSFYGQRVLARQLNRYLKDYAQRAGIKKNVHFHTIRHTFATELYRQTGDLGVVKRALRHKSISSTEVYTHIVKDDVVKALKKANL